VKGQGAIGVYMKKKGLILLSGGLDSTLAAEVMLEQGIELEAINFSLIFHTTAGWAKRVAERLSIKYRSVDITGEYLDILKNPKHGYGSNINPCIDCRIHMLKIAKACMKDMGASFVVTGEVLGERPMSQHLNNLNLIERESGLKGLIVRPLSAKLLEPSLPEIEGVIDRERLLNIQGRSRKPQISLAGKYNIGDYPAPAGGCLLTDERFTERLKDLMANGDLTIEKIELLKLGRHFRLGRDTRLIVGRNEAENESLSGKAIDGDIFFEPKTVPGPTGLLRGSDISPDQIERAASIISRYSDRTGDTVMIEWREHPKEGVKETAAPPAHEEELKEMRI
ncbi:MAG: hypothetical protein ABH875_05470, partial [Candidatus Omnitrophota bacterium]